LEHEAAVVKVIHRWKREGAVPAAARLPDRRRRPEEPTRRRTLVEMKAVADTRGDAG
jgi:predicted site-specific integrase-resolvase